MAHKNSLKGISPLVATVLLIAFVVAVAGILATWINTFAQEQTELVGDQSNIAISCSYGAVALKNMAFTSAESRLSGTIENNGQISIGGMSVSVVYQNATSQNIPLCNGQTGAVDCASANYTLPVAGQGSFNVSIWGSNYDSVKLITNCSSVSDSVERSDIG